MIRKREPKHMGEVMSDIAERYNKLTKTKMSKEEIIELINSRIKYYTGGEAWKSLNESICDKRIVDELESIKENILNQNRDE